MASPQSMCHLHVNMLRKQTISFKSVVRRYFCTFGRVRSRDLSFGFESPVLLLALGKCDLVMVTDKSVLICNRNEIHYPSKYSQYKYSVASLPFQCVGC